MEHQEKKVPNLRFKGFTNDWEQHKLGEVAKVTMGQSPSSKNYTDNPNDYVLVQGNADLKSNEISPRVWTKEVTKKVHKGEFIMTVRAPVGYLATANMDAVIGRGVAAIDGNKYLYYLLQTKLLDRTWEKLSSGSTFESISSNDIKNLEIKVTETEEEKLIAKLMDTVTYFVTLQQRKLDFLKQLKKGLLQKMFADKGSKRPILRFEGFNDDWERRKLGDLVVIKSGLSTNTQSRQGFYKITRIETISKGLIDMDKTGSVQIKPDDKYLMHAGDILFSNINSLKHIGKVAIFNGKSTLYHGMNLLRMTAQSNVSSHFIYYQLITDKHSNWAKAHANPAVSQASINQHALSLEPMYITKLEEQHEISDFIGKLDSIITFQQQKLVRINKIKKSLLQQIFI